MPPLDLFAVDHSPALSCFTEEPRSYITGPRHLHGSTVERGSDGDYVFAIIRRFCRGLRGLIKRASSGQENCAPGELPDGVLVIRFSPMGLERLQKLRDQAEDEFEESHMYGLSVLVGAAGAGEDRASAMGRLGRVAFGMGLSQIRHCWCSTAGDLQARGLTLRPAPPPEEHYNVDLGVPLTDDRISDFIAAFGDKERLSHDGPS